MNNKENQEKIPNVEKDGWDAEELAEQATNEESDDIVRRMRRGDETVGNPDERDVAGVPDYEELKNKKEQAKKNN